ncbi:MAG: hypothetical protein QG639_789 [Patescibacteria group bacterium]|nr:hypothetical protein [Patescibacteria group bacterium]
MVKELLSDHLTIHFLLWLLVAMVGVWVATKIKITDD